MIQAQSGLVTYTLSVTVLEDLHHGAGLGGGLIDALFSRDRLGQPTIRWNHLKGLLRDALYERQNALNQPPDQTHALANRLFGHDAPSPAGTDRSGLVSGTSLYCQPTKAVDSVVWTSASREVGKRSPAPDTMHQIEFIPAQTKFKSELQFLSLTGDSLPTHGPTPMGVKHWLEKLLRRVNRLGAQKSRGAGLICISFGTLEREQAKQANPVDASAALSPPATYRLLLENLDPLCLPTTGIPGNIIGTETYVPARALHGALVRYILAHGHHEAANAMLTHEHQLSNAYPVGLSADLATKNFETLAAMPRPLGLHKTKFNAQQSELPYWLEAPTAGTVHDTLGEDQPMVKTKRPSDHDYLFTQDGSNWTPFTQQTRLRLRNNAGQVLREGLAQALYSTEEIPERTCFVATLVLPTNTDHAQAIANALHKLQQGHWLLLGRGGTPVRLAKLCELVKTAPASLNAAAATTLSATTATSTAAADFSFRLVLLSDTLVRDSNFAHHRSLSLSALRDMLITAALNQLNLPDEVQIKAASDATEVHGYNYAVRLPRMQAIALRRGSELCMTGEGAAKWYEALWALKTSGAGLGERCFEGYGQFELFTTRLTLASQTKAASNQFKENLIEADLAKVDAEWEELAALKKQAAREKRTALIEAFTVTRWQALRNAARASDKQARPKMLGEWIKQAEREASRKAAKDMMPSIGEFLKNFGYPVSGPTATNWPALTLFAERAAKQVQRQNIDKRKLT